MEILDQLMDRVLRKYPLEDFKITISKVKSFRSITRIIYGDNTQDSELEIGYKALVDKHKLDISHFSRQPKLTAVQSAKNILAHRTREKIKDRERRTFPKNRARWILRNSKSGDTTYGRQNNLTRVFIENKLKNADYKCEYCNESSILLTLDRIDNSKGHLQDNVNVACNRCNSIRGSMPYEPWLLLVPKIKEIKEKGLFGNWIGIKSPTLKEQAEKDNLDKISRSDDKLDKTDHK